MRIAVVTGASSGLGREFAEQITKLYRQLDSIWIVARSTEELMTLKEELNCQYAMDVKIFDGDLARDYIYERIERELDREDADVRMLVNCAGYGKMGEFRKIPAKEQLGMIQLNCTALTRMILTCKSHLSGGSRIINVASAAAFSPQPGFAVYAASKAYVKSLSHALAIELKERGIYVTAVCPGPVDTAFFDRAGELPGRSEKMKRADAAKVVHKALLDAAKKRQISVYGMTMKNAGFVAKFLPDAWLSRIMGRINQV